MSVLIVIVNYGTAPMSLRAAHAAVDAARELDCEWSLSIVDNKSPDDSVAVLSSELAACRAAQRPGWDKVQLLQSDHNGGFGAGNNLAIHGAFASATPPQYVYLLNSDAFAQTGTIVALKGYMDAHADVGVTGSYIHGMDGEPHNTAFRFPSLFSEFEDSVRLGFISGLLQRWRVSIGILDHTQTVDWVAGASMMLRASALAEADLFDEGFFLYFEETELCLRLKRAGWRTVYVPASRIAHIGGATTGMNKFSNSRVPQYWLDSRHRYFAKSHGWWYLLLANIIRIVGLSLWHIRRLIQRKENSHPPGLLGDLIAHFLNKCMTAVRGMGRSGS